MEAGMTKTYRLIGFSLYAAFLAAGGCIFDSG
jgi:hypothetical protein